MERESHPCGQLRGKHAGQLCGVSEKGGGRCCGPSLVRSGKLENWKEVCKLQTEVRKERRPDVGQDGRLVAWDMEE